jgi:glycosyltransferase involved in cell wall biosynthesis
MDRNVQCWSTTARGDFLRHPARRRAGAHYASGDLFLFPSLTETFGNVVLEAMASGLGVVAYDQAAQHIRHGYNGVLAMPGDEDAFCDAAIWLLEERETLRRVAQCPPTCQPPGLGGDYRAVRAPTARVCEDAQCPS